MRDGAPSLSTLRVSDGGVSACAGGLCEYLRSGLATAALEHLLFGCVCGLTVVVRTLMQGGRLEAECDADTDARLSL